MSRYAHHKQADELVDWLTGRSEIGAARREELLRARGLALADFEDAVVCAVAETCGCDAIVTCNLGDLGRSPVRALSAEECLMPLHG